MALIKKQIFRPSKDENLQQFFAKEHGENMEMRWGQPASKNKANTQARKKGLIRGVPEKAGDAPKKAPPKAEPKSPWDDESDALDPGTKVEQKAFEVDPEGGTRRVPSADDKKKADRAKRDRLFERSMKYVKNFEDQGSDNSNSADDRTQKEFIIEGVQDAWFEKRGDGVPERYWERSTGDPFPPDTPSTAASSRYSAAETPSSKRMDTAMSSGRSDSTKGLQSWSPESAKRPPGKGQKAKWVAEDYDADEDGPHKVEGHWKSKMQKAIQGEYINMNYIQKAVWDAYFEKADPNASPAEKGRRNLEAQKTKAMRAEKLESTDMPFSSVAPGTPNTPQARRAGTKAYNLNVRAGAPRESARGMARTVRHDTTAGGDSWSDANYTPPPKPKG